MGERRSRGLEGRRKAAAARGEGSAAASHEVEGHVVGEGPSVGLVVGGQRWEKEEGIVSRFNC